MKKINYAIILFLYYLLSQTVSVRAMERLLCKSPNQILKENLQNMQIEWQMPATLIKELTIISYIQDIDMSDKYIYTCPLCDRQFAQKINLMKHINTTNIKPLYNTQLNGCNNNEINDEYFLEWINK